MGVKGYLPPEGPQNVHRVPYEWLPARERHSVANVTIRSPEQIILTGDPNAHRTIEQAGLEQVPDELADSALEAWENGENERIDQMVLDYRDNEGADPEAHPEANREIDVSDRFRERDSNAPVEIPADLSGIPRSVLQSLAGYFDRIPGNQSNAYLRDALAKVRESGDPRIETVEIEQDPDEIQVNESGEIEQDPDPDPDPERESGV